MGLMIGKGPFGPEPAGEFNFPMDTPPSQLYWEVTPRKVRAVVNGQTIAESTNAKLLHETGHLPVYYFPESDIRLDLLEPSNTTTTCPHKGEASYWSIVTSNDRRKDIVWSYPEPKEGAPWLARHYAFYFDQVDEWWEEAEQIGVHPRDPYHRIDVIDTDRHVIVKVNGTTVADSHRATMLFETGLTPRLYLPAIDVDHSTLVRSDTVTSCPYKGTTSRYFDIEVGDTRIEDAIWVYDHPKPETTGIAGKLAFYNHKVDLIVDGQPYDSSESP